MKRIFTLLLIFLTVAASAYAIQTNFPGDPGPNTTPADIETKPDKYYEPQPQPRDTNSDMMPTVNPVPGGNHY